MRLQSFAEAAAPEVFCKKAFLKSFAIFSGKHLCWSLFLIKLKVFRPATLLKRDSNTGDFLWILWKLSEMCYYQLSCFHAQTCTRDMRRTTHQVLNFKSVKITKFYIISKHVNIYINLTRMQYGFFQFYISQFSYWTLCKGHLNANKTCKVYLVVIMSKDLFTHVLVSLPLQ